MSDRYLILDFDGTCTDVPNATERYLAEYHRLLSARFAVFTDEEWKSALQWVAERSPGLGWTLKSTPSAPAAADPYIQAFEAASHLRRLKDISGDIPGDLHGLAYDAAPGALRPELPAVLAAAADTGWRIHFVTNSSTAKVAHRITDLLATDTGLRERIGVTGNAAKFLVCEPAVDGKQGKDGKPGWTPPAPELRARFAALPATEPCEQLERPIYLRRGAYFDALAAIWGTDLDAPGNTLVCGDVYELDLAMPAALGCAVHLIERGSPFATCKYETDAVARLGTRGNVSVDLRGLLARFR